MDGFYKYAPAATALAKQQQQYGAAGKPELVERHRPSQKAMFVCFLAPICIYALVSGVMSFSVHFFAPWLSWVLSLLCLACVVLFGTLAFTRLRLKLAPGRGSARAPGWYVFLFATGLLAWVLGMLMGFTNYYDNTLAKAQIEDLMTYRGVDPATWTGAQLMDAGVAEFTAGSKLDVSRSIGFKNVEQYCVAPIVRDGQSPSSVEIWAVGLDCCTGHPGDFRCGEWDNPAARAGLRLMREDQRGFYRLAVTQAAATFGLKSDHPVFFFWMADPQVGLNAYQAEAVRSYVIGLLAFFAMQVFFTLVAEIVFSKLGM